MFTNLCSLDFSFELDDSKQGVVRIEAVTETMRQELGEVLAEVLHSFMSCVVLGVSAHHDCAFLSIGLMLHRLIDLLKSKLCPVATADRLVLRRTLWTCTRWQYPTCFIEVKAEEEWHRVSVNSRSVVHPMHRALEHVVR